MPKQLVAVDVHVADYQKLIDQLGDQYRFLVLTSESDSLGQLADFVSANPGYDAIHLISHGAPGQIQLGSQTISGANVGSYADQLQRIGQGVRAGGDLLLYGCDVAQGIDGQRLITDLARLTKLDVAASTDLTGNRKLNANWTLEVNEGTTIPPIQFEPYGGTLAIPSNGNDALTGSEGNDTILGLGGNDTILGLVGNDSLDGGAGNNQIDGGDGNDTLLGGIGNDSLNGGSGNDLIDGGDGDNTLVGGLGADTIIGGNGFDRVSFASGDTVRTNGGNDVVSWSEDGVDFPYTSIATSVDTGDGADVINISYRAAVNAAISIKAGAGDDSINLNGFSGNYEVANRTSLIIDGGGDYDTLTVGTDAADTTASTLRFSNFEKVVVNVGLNSQNLIFDDELVTAPNLNLIINANTGYSSWNNIDLSKETNATVTGQINTGQGSLVEYKGSQQSDIINLNQSVAGWYSIISTNDGDDYVYSSTTASRWSPGTNQFNLGSGDDTIVSVDGVDSIVGGSGNDSISAGAYNDTIDGGQGDDTIDGGNGTDTAIYIGKYSDYTITAGVGEVTIAGASGTDSLRNINTLQFDDQTVSLTWAGSYLVGTDSNDSIEGGENSDLISGGIGNDSLNGLIGNDFLDGGVGNDTLEGGVGKDTVVAGDGNDLIIGGNGAGEPSPRGYHRAIRRPSRKGHGGR